MLGVLNRLGFGYVLLTRPFESGGGVGLQERPDAEEFCRGLRPRLVGALSPYCGDVQVAEDTAQTAVLMGCAEGTVKALTHQALALLRNDPTVRDLTATEVSDV